MLSGLNVPVTMYPAAIMLACAVLAAAYAMRLLRPARGNNDPLSGLFQRETLEGQVREAVLLSSNAARPRRSARPRKFTPSASRAQMLEQIATVMRGGERDEAIVRETQRYLAGEGFIIVDDRSAYAAAQTQTNPIHIGDFEEVKLLAPPSPAKAA